MNVRILLISCLIVMIPHGGCAQDDLLKELEALESKKPDYVIATFKGTRLINLQTTETLHKGSLDFRISHRFGDINSGKKNLWGLDGPAVLRLGLDYSVTDQLTIGVGRTSYKKIVDGFVKYRLLRQVNGGMPVTLTGLAGASIITEDDPVSAITGVDRYEYFTSRMAFLYQAMVARKFTSAFSLQISPVFIHYNLVTRANDKNDILAMAASGRFKFTRSIALTLEYVYRVTRYTPDEDSYHNVLGVGFDVETGGHVFQLFLTNGSAINETQLVPFTSGAWKDKEVRFGFNISRVFEFRNRNRE